MKSTGIVRAVDPLGRVVLPIELRRSMSIGTNDGLEIFTEGNTIILRKYNPGCTFCGSVDGKMIHFGGQLICEKCSNEIREALKGQKENR